MNIIKGKASPAPRRVIYGLPGVGKSTFACAEPRAIAIDYEQGLDSIGVDRVTGPKTWGASLELLKEACSGPGDHHAIVVDTLDKLEEQATHLVCAEGKKKSLADFGYGDGYEALVTKWREMLQILESARAHGRSVTLVCHVQQKTQDDPMLGKYDKLIAALSKKCWGVTHRWADAVLFANYEAGMIEGRAIMTGARLLYTQAATGFDAKHRPNIASPIPLSWDAYAQAVAASNRTADEILLSISKLVTKETADKAQKFIQEANGDTLRLAKIETALRNKV